MMPSISRNLLSSSSRILLMLMQSRKASCGRSVPPLASQQKAKDKEVQLITTTVVSTSIEINHLKSETPCALEMYRVLIHDVPIIFADPIPESTNSLMLARSEILCHELPKALGQNGKMIICVLTETHPKPKRLQVRPLVFCLLIS